MRTRIAKVGGERDGEVGGGLRDRGIGSKRERGGRGRVRSSARWALKQVF